jgi:enoyl-CoA hydratase/carnithine racemase
MYETIFYDVTDHLATITLNRPEKLNAYLSQMMEEMVEALDRADADHDVRAIIVTGAGRAYVPGPTCRQAAPHSIMAWMAVQTSRWARTARSIMGMMRCDQRVVGRCRRH